MRPQRLVNLLDKDTAPIHVDEEESVHDATMPYICIYRKHFGNEIRIVGIKNHMFWIQIHARIEKGQQKTRAIDIFPKCIFFEIWIQDEEKTTDFRGNKNRIRILDRQVIVWKLGKAEMRHAECNDVMEKDVGLVGKE